MRSIAVIRENSVTCLWLTARRVRPGSQLQTLEVGDQVGTHTGSPTTAGRVALRAADAAGVEENRLAARGVAFVLEREVPQLLQTDRSGPCREQALRGLRDLQAERPDADPLPRLDQE